MGGRMLDDYKREEDERTAQAKALWEKKYKHLKPHHSKKSVDSCGDWLHDFYFTDWVKDEEKEERVKETHFTFTKDWVSHNSKISRHQKFLAVNGPLKGKYVKQANKDYVMYNIHSRARNKEPRVVAVHRESLK